jgi:hypothetical protein
MRLAEVKNENIVFKKVIGKKDAYQLLKSHNEKRA